MTEPKPLAGTVVLDISQGIAGPSCGGLFAEYGARVIKVEAPGRGDDARQIGPFVNGRSAYFSSLNRGKESIALDLKDDADRAVFERLLARADVLRSVNAAIEAGELVNRDGKTLSEPLKEALVTDDGKTMYPIADGIPVLLEGEAVALRQIEAA